MVLTHVKSFLICFLFKLLHSPPLSSSLLSSPQFHILIMAQNGTSNDFTVKAGLAQMLKGGVIMDVVNAEQVRSRAIYAASTASR